MYEYLDRRYALALYEVAESKGKVKEYLQDLREICDLIENNHDFYEVIRHPQINTRRKKQTFINIFKGKIDEELLSFLLILIEKDRILYLREKLNEMEKIDLERKNTLKGVIRTAVPLLDNELESLKNIFEKLYKSVPFMTYILMLILAIIGIKIPAPIISITSLIGAANGFMAMLMVGLMFEISFKWDYISKAFFILIIRYIFAGITAFIFYNFLPFSLVIRQVLVIAIFAPISALSSYFTEKCDGNSGLSSFASSLSIIFSIIIITFLIIYLEI